MQTGSQLWIQCINYYLVSYTRILLAPRPFLPENCELSDQDFSTLNINNPDHAEQETLYQHYERQTPIENCLDG